MTSLRLPLAARTFATPRRGALTAGLLLGGLLATVIWPQGAAPRLAGLGLFGAVVWLVQARIEGHHPHARFGPANAITLARAAGAAWIAALAVTPLVPDTVLWAACGVSAGLLLLDGLDGWTARRSGTVSAFGARFDMETDALTILVLALMAFRLGKAGIWVLGLGLMRYGFVLAGRVWPALRAPLPPSFRRKAVCVAQLGVLTALLAPPVTPPLSDGLALAAFAALTWSFAADLRWLNRRTR